MEQKKEHVFRVFLIIQILILIFFRLDNNNYLINCVSATPNKGGAVDQGPAFGAETDTGELARERDRHGRRLMVVCSDHPTL